MKFRALRLDHGNFAWASEVVTRKTRIIDVVYNASNNELVRKDLTGYSGCHLSIYAADLGVEQGYVCRRVVGNSIQGA